MKRHEYAVPCAGCLCDHCANNLYSSDKMAGEAKIFCYVCEECRYYDGDLKNKDMRCKQCENYIVTNEHVERLRKKLGDVMWYVAMICESMELDIDEIFQMNINKLKARYPEGFDPDKANHRRTDDI